jgi:hypothetical protein
MNDTPAKRRLLHGAKAIARYIGDESLSVALRHHSDEWPLFLVGNILCAFETSIDAALLEKEQRGIPPQRPPIQPPRPPIQPPRPPIQKPRKSLGSHGEAIFQSALTLNCVSSFARCASHSSRSRSSLVSINGCLGRPS